MVVQGVPAVNKQLASVVLSQPAPTFISVVDSGLQPMIELAEGARALVVVYCAGIFVLGAGQ